MVTAPPVGARTGVDAAAGGADVGVIWAATGLSSTNSGGVVGDAGWPVRLSMACMPAGTCGGSAAACCCGCWPPWSWTLGLNPGRMVRSLEQAPGLPGPSRSGDTPGAGANTTEGRVGALMQVLDRTRPWG